MEKKSLQISDREEELARCEAALAALNNEHDAMKTAKNEAALEAESLQAEVGRMHTELVATVAEIERMARENYGVIHAMKKLDNEEATIRREYEAIEQTRDSKTREREEVVSRTKAAQDAADEQRAERQEIERVLREMESEMRQRRAEAERQNAELREADARAR